MLGIDAGVCLPPKAEPESALRYLETLIDALSYAKSARDRKPLPLAGKANPLGTATALMEDLKTADAEYECAIAHVQPYTSSQIEAVNASASGVVLVFRSLIDLDERTLAVLKDLFNREPDNIKLGDLADNLSDMNTESAAHWSRLTVASIMATYSVVEYDPSTGAGLGRLSLTSLEREHLLNKLDDVFGESIHDGIKVGQLPLEASASALYAFLADKRWKSKAP